MTKLLTGATATCLYQHRCKPTRRIALHQTCLTAALSQSTFDFTPE